MPRLEHCEKCEKDCPHRGSPLPVSIKRNKGISYAECNSVLRFINLTTERKPLSNQQARASWGDAAAQY